MKVIPLSAFGLETVAEVSARKGEGWSLKSVQNWINDGLLPVVVVGVGRSAKFLLRSRDVDAFEPPGRGTRTDLVPKPAKGRAKKK